MSNQAIVDSFSASLKLAYSRKSDHIDDQATFDRKYSAQSKTEYDAAIRIIDATRNVQLLSDLSAAYLDLFFKYDKDPGTRNNTRFYRSDQTFFELFDRCKKISTGRQDLFAKWTAMITGSAASQLKTRFETLSATYQSKIRELVLKPESKAKTILDYLRDAFLAKRGYPAKSDNDLYNFDPVPGPELKGALDNQINALQKQWNVCVRGNEEIPRSVLHGNLDGFRTYLQGMAKVGVLPLFQVIKYLQDRIMTKRENVGTWTRVSGGDRSPLTCELYAMACLELLVIGQGKLLLPTNRDQFTVPERNYLLAPLRENKSEYEYYSNLEDRFTRPLRDVPRTFDLTKTFLDLILLTHNQISGASLLPLKPTLAIQTRWENIDKLTSRLRSVGPGEQAQLVADPANASIAKEFSERLAIEVPLGNRDLEIAFARIGASPGVHQMLGRITIVDIDSKHPDRFYIEYEALKPNLFLVDTGYITTKVYASRIYEIHRSTAGMIYVIAGMFLMMGFLPVLVETGFAGLIHEVLLYYGSSKLEEQVEQVNPVLGKIVGFAVLILFPRPKFTPKVVDPNLPTVEPRVPGYTLTEVKSGTATESRGTMQIDEAWLDKTAKGIGDEERGLRPATEPAAAKPSRPQQQQLQQQQAKVPERPADPAAATTKSSDPPSSRRIPRQQQQQVVGVRRDQPTVETRAKAETSQPGARDATSAKGTADRRVGNSALDTAGNPGTTVTGTGQGTITFQSRLTQREYAIRGGEQLRSSTGGHQVYVYRKGSRVAYVGKSGQIGESGGRIEQLDPGTRETPFNNWIDRLRQDHVNTVWIDEVDRVEVFSDLSAEEMDALEAMTIDLNSSNVAGHWNWNERGGDYAPKYGRIEDAYKLGREIQARRRPFVFQIEPAPGTR